MIAEFIVRILSGATVMVLAFLLYRRFRDAVPLVRYLRDQGVPLDPGTATLVEEASTSTARPERPA